jgi:hypothetical protein
VKHEGEVVRGVDEDMDSDVSAARGVGRDTGSTHGAGGGAGAARGAGVGSGAACGAVVDVGTARGTGRDIGAVRGMGVGALGLCVAWRPSPRYLQLKRGRVEQ